MFRLVAVGETCAGKSSLVQSLIKGSPDPTTMADRTQVVEISTWKVSDTDIFRIYDQGGHVIYDITNPLFISRRSTVIHVHNLNDLEHCKCFAGHCISTQTMRFILP